MKLVPYKQLRYKHNSDCSLFNRPAEQIKDCDCDVALALLDESLLFLRGKENSLFTKEQLATEIDWCFAANHEESCVKN